MPIIVTYDINVKHTELKNLLKSDRYNYFDRLTNTQTNKVIYLPNTTLYHQTNTPSMAVHQVQTLCNQLGIRLERCISTEWKNADYIYGEDF